MKLLFLSIYNILNILVIYLIENLVFFINLKIIILKIKLSYSSELRGEENNLCLPCSEEYIYYNRIN